MESDHEDWEHASRPAGGASGISGLHHIGLGYEHNGTTVCSLVHSLHITGINADTGEIIRDPARDYQPLGRPRGPPRASGRMKKTPQT